MSLETINNTLLTIAAHLKDIVTHLENLDYIEKILRKIAENTYTEEGED